MKPKNSTLISFLAAAGRFTEALRELHQILTLDPMSVLTYKRIARVFWKMGRHESALSYLTDVIEIEDTDYEAYVLAGAILTDIGRYGEAFEMLEKSYEIEPSLETLSMIGYAKALAGEKDNSLKIVNEINSEKHHQGVTVKLARIYLALGDKETVYALLDKALSEHEIDLIVLGCDPRWRPIRNEEPFKRLLERIGVIS